VVFDRGRLTESSLDMGSRYPVGYTCSPDRWLRPLTHPSDSKVILGPANRECKPRGSSRASSLHDRRTALRKGGVGWHVRPPVRPSRDAGRNTRRPGTRRETSCRWLLVRRRASLERPTSSTRSLRKLSSPFAELALAPVRSYLAGRVKEVDCEEGRPRRLCRSPRPSCGM